jgi:hypothetical protein
MSTIRARLLDNPELWLVAVVVLVLGPFVQAMTAQPAARYALTGAIWEHHTVDVGRYPVLIDRATLDNGELRSDKAPGQPLLAVPAFALGRLAGVEPATHPRFAENLGLWWVTLFSTVLPLALLAVLLRRVAVGLGSTAPTIVALVIVFGTTIADVATQLFGHALAALFAYGAWYVLRGAARDGRAPWVVGGLLAGCAVITEYTTFLIGLVLAAFVLWRARERFLWFVLGALPAAAVGAIYDQIAFGAPWRVSYSTKHVRAGGFFGINPPHLRIFLRVVFDQKGLLALTPIVVLAVVLACMQARRPGPGRVDAIVTLACFVLLLLVQSGWTNPWGGEYAGPRYLIPALPFLAAPLAVGWQRVRPLAIALSLWSVAIMSLSYITDGLVPTNGSAMSLWFQRIGDRAFTPTIFTMTFGGAGTLFHVVLAVGAGVGLWHATTRLPRRDALQPAA